MLPADTAWDTDKINAELEQLVEMKLAEVKRAAVEAAAQQAGVAVDDLPADQREAAEASCKLTLEEEDAARALHPVRRYAAGLTRFQLDTPDQGPNGPTTARAYLKADERPLIFELRRVPWRVRASIDGETDPRARWEAWIREGVAAVIGDPALAWRAKSPSDHLPDKVLDVLCESEGSYLNLIPVAAACMKFGDPLMQAELFRSGSGPSAGR